MADLHPQTKVELDSLVNKLKRLAPAVRKVAQADLLEASKILVSAMKGRAPSGVKTHKRYSTPKLVKGLRAPKGFGKVVATYKPGNLKKSFTSLRFRRSEAVFVGPAVGIKRPNDGYYAHMVNFGTKFQPGQHFVEATVAAAGNVTIQFAAELLKRRIETYENQNGV